LSVSASCAYFRGWVVRTRLREFLLATTIDLLNHRCLIQDDWYKYDLHVAVPLTFGLVLRRMGRGVSIVVTSWVPRGMSKALEDLKRGWVHRTCQSWTDCFQERAGHRAEEEVNCFSSKWKSMYKTSQNRRHKIFQTLTGASIDIPVPAPNHGCSKIQ
jgi:hypothetical protein